MMFTLSWNLTRKTVQILTLMQEANFTVKLVILSSMWSSINYIMFVEEIHALLQTGNA